MIGTRHAAKCTAAASDPLPANLEDDQATCDWNQACSCTAAASDSLPENPEYGIVDPADAFFDTVGTLLAHMVMEHSGGGATAGQAVPGASQGSCEPLWPLGDDPIGVEGRSGQLCC